MPRVSVVIPHYNDLAGLTRCLASLDAQTLPRDQFEIVVGDNRSPVPRDALDAAISGRARLTIVAEKGAGPARNGAVVLTTGDILAFIDSDCVAAPGWLEAGVAGLERYDFIGGRVRVFVDHDGPLTEAEAFETVFAFDFEDYILRQGFTGSGNMFVSRAVFDAVGGFRTGVSEDKEWSLRATAKGFRLGYVPQAEIAHPARRHWRDLMERWRRLSRERHLLDRERPLGALRWLARTWVTPFTALAHTPKVLRHPDLPDARARWRALVALYRLRLWRFADGHRQMFGRS